MNAFVRRTARSDPTARRRPRLPRSTAELVSVLVCTRGRPDSLRRCLVSLRELDDPHFEVVVVENTAEPQLEADVTALGFRHVHEPRLGLDRARNRGIEEAAGTLVAFTDDDCEVDPGWLRAARTAFRARDVSCVTGRVVPASLSRPSERLFEARFSFDRGIDRRQIHRDLPLNARTKLFPGLVGAGCNMTFRKEIFNRIGGFDEALDMGTLIGGGGDIDIFSRVIDAGEVIAYAPDAVVVHHDRRTMPELRKQMFGYGVSQGALCMKYVLTRRGGRGGSAWQFVATLRHSLLRTGRWMRRSSAYPISLVVVESAGLSVGPFAYLLERLRVRRARR